MTKLLPLPSPSLNRVIIALILWVGTSSTSYGIIQNQEFVTCIYTDSINKILDEKTRHLSANEIEKELDLVIEQTPPEDQTKVAAIIYKANYFTELDKGIEAFALVEQYVDYFKAQKNKTAELDLTLWLAERYLMSSDFPQAFEYLLILEKELKEIGYDNYPKINNFFEAISHAYYYFRDVDQAKMYLDTAMYFKFTSHRNKINILNNRALICKLEADTCGKNFIQTALQIAKENRDTAWIGVLSGNLAQFYLKQGEVDTADSLLLTDFNFSIYQNELQSASFAGIELANIRMRKGKLLFADSLLQQIARLAPMYERKSPALASHFYSAKSLFYHLNNQHQLAFTAADSAAHYQTKINTEQNIQLGKKLEQKVSTERHLAQLKLLDQEYKQKVTFRNILILIAIVIILLLAAIYRQYRLKRDKEKQVMVLEHTYTEERLNNAQQQLKEYVQNIQKKNQLIESFNREIDLLKDHQAQIDDSKKNEIKNQLCDHSLLTDQDWYEFKRLFNNVYPQYFERLENKFPHLTFAETRLFLLSKLGLSYNESAGLLGISPNSVRKTLLRLRKKIEIEDNADFLKLVHDI